MSIRTFILFISYIQFFFTQLNYIIDWNIVILNLLLNVWIRSFKVPLWMLSWCSSFLVTLLLKHNLRNLKGRGCVVLEITFPSPVKWYSFNTDHEMWLQVVAKTKLWAWKIRVRNWMRICFFRFIKLLLRIATMKQRAWGIICCLLFF